MTATVGGRYELQELLGSGGVAEVWRARDRASGELVAVKQLLPQFASDRSTCLRFSREAEIVRLLEHPGIVSVRDAGETAGRPFLVMELVAGEDLRRRLDREGRLAPSESWRIALAIAEALAHAHARGVVHRDLKPQNVLLEDATVKLTDFGMARVESVAGMTGSSLVWGSPEYMAPELFGRGRVDPRTDLYSFGVLLFEMVSGHLPWKEGRALGRLFTAPGAEPLASLGHGEALDQLMAALLSPSLDDRPSSAAEVIATLKGEAPPAALVRTVRCEACGEARPEDIPRCPACGRAPAVLPQSPGGRWRVLATTVREDADSMAALTRALGALTGRTDLDLKFRTGNQNMYGDEERRAAIELPALIFSELDEPTAKAISTELSAAGVRAIATPKRVEPALLTRKEKVIFGGLGFISVVPFLSQWQRAISHGHWGLIFMIALMPALMLGFPFGFWAVKVARLRPLFGLRAPVSAGGPVAEQLLAEGARISAALTAPEARALFVAAHRALYRLTRRAEELARPDAPASTEQTLARRMLEAAPGINARLESAARRLATLDAALDADGEGDIVRALALLARRAGTAPEAEQPALDDARRNLEASLDRRLTLEVEREQLAANLCQALASLRDTWSRAASLTTPDERDLALIEAALRELG